MEGNQKFKHNREENKIPNVQSLKVVGKHLENGSLGNFQSKEQRIVEETAHQHEKVSEKRKERKDKSKHKSSSDGRGDKHKDGDRERKSKSKDKKEKKAKKMEGKVNEVATPTQAKLIENGNVSVDIQNGKGSYPFKGSSSSNGCLGKRKEPEMNGFIHGKFFLYFCSYSVLASYSVDQNYICSYNQWMLLTFWYGFKNRIHENFLHVLKVLV